MNGIKNFNKKLLVEGKDDLHVISNLCKECNVVETFNVLDCKSCDEILKVISVSIKQSDFDAIGIVIDADASIKNRWTSLKAILESLGFAVPDILPPAGLILGNTNGQKVGVWIMPDNNLNGMLEDFVALLVPPEDKLLAIVNSTLDNIEGQQLNKYADIHRPKAVIHSWLSWQEDPGTPMGLAITKKYLTTNGETCTRLIQWLNDLFN